MTEEKPDPLEHINRMIEEAGKRVDRDGGVPPEFADDEWHAINDRVMRVSKALARIVTGTWSTVTKLWRNAASNEVIDFRINRGENHQYGNVTLTYKMFERLMKASGFQLDVEIDNDDE